MALDFSGEHSLMRGRRASISVSRPNQDGPVGRSQHTRRYGAGHPHAGEAAAQGRAEEPHDRLRMPRRGGGVLLARRIGPAAGVAQRVQRRIGRRPLAEVAKRPLDLVPPRRDGRVGS